MLEHRCFPGPYNYKVVITCIRVDVGCLVRLLKLTYLAIYLGGVGALGDRDDWQVVPFDRPFVVPIRFGMATMISSTKRLSKGAVRQSTPSPSAPRAQTTFNGSSSRRRPPTSTRKHQMTASLFWRSAKQQRISSIKHSRNGSRRTR